MEEALSARLPEPALPFILELPLPLGFVEFRFALDAPGVRAGCGVTRCPSARGGNGQRSALAGELAACFDRVLAGRGTR